MTARERLVNTLRSHMNDGWQHEAERLADKLLAEGMTMPPGHTPPPVWPGLEGEGLRRAVDAWNAAMPANRPEGMSWDDVDRRGYTAVAAYLWRAMVASIPDDTDYPGGWVMMGSVYVPRTALAALADPYDGGGK
ncbi:MAG: hypothetical protein IPF77_16800 [Gemmatimonadetes bacterium]|nr:hypothetical protein [Gemmatimonadota bacterium]